MAESPLGIVGPGSGSLLDVQLAVRHTIRPVVILTIIVSVIDCDTVTAGSVPARYPSKNGRAFQILRTLRKRRPATSATYVERVNRAIDHVVGHLREPIRLNDLSRAARLSPFHFHRVFQALVGATPAEFVKRLRLEMALGMMARPRPPSLTSVALACGFSSSSDFTRCFKQRFGVPPSAFNVKTWQTAHVAQLKSVVERAVGAARLERLPSRNNPDQFRVKVRELPARSVAYIRVDRPYRGNGVFLAARRLMNWADQNGLGHGQWLGYQWDNPAVT